MSLSLSLLEPGPGKQLTLLQGGEEGEAVLCVNARLEERVAEEDDLWVRSLVESCVVRVGESRSALRAKG